MITVVNVIAYILVVGVCASLFALMGLAIREGINDKKRRAIEAKILADHIGETYVIPRKIIEEALAAAKEVA